MTELESITRPFVNDTKGPKSLGFMILRQAQGRVINQQDGEILAGLGKMLGTGRILT